MQKVEEGGGEIYIVGGAVRDLLIGREIYDWDFATNLRPEEMQKIFPKNGFYNNEFGTFRVVGKDKEIFEITTYRSEKGYGDFRHPSEVVWGKSIEEDLSRRDFTINAIGLGLDHKIIDIFGGQEDVKNKLVRAVGVAEERFAEDALRILRAFRLAAQLGFMIEEKTMAAAESKAPLLANISGERIRDDFFKLLVGDHPAQALTLMKNTGVLKELLPEILEGYGVIQKGHHVYDVWTHGIKALENTSSRDPVTRLAVLLHDVAKPRVMLGEGEARTFHNHEVVGARMAVAVGKRLKLSNKQLDQLFRLVRWHMFSSDTIQTDKSVRRFIRNVTPEYINEMISLRRADRLGSGAKESSWRWEEFQARVIEVQKQPFSIKDLKVNGVEVMALLGIKPGPQVGKVLNYLFAQVEEKPELNEKETLVKMVETLKGKEI